MEASEYRRLAAIEDSHWWYRAMHELVTGVIKQGLTLKGSTLLRLNLKKILDAGCGSGGLTKKLERFGEVIGLDVSPLALKFAKKRKLKLIEGSVNSSPFSDECFDLAVSTSVIYHRLVDENKVVEEFYRVLKPKGKIILILPAFSWARGSHDESVHTRKRYTLSGAMRLMEFGGFRVIEKRYIFSFLFPVFIIKRLTEKIFPKQKIVSDLEVIPSFFNSLLFWLCRLEWKLGDFIKLPFGSSLLIVGEKK